MAHTHKSNWELIKNGMFSENTIFRMAISLCPSIAVTNSLKNGYGRTEADRHPEDGVHTEHPVFD